MTDRLRAQYEAFPYPARDPRDEAKRLITGSPGHLDEVNHHVFGGRLFERGLFERDKPFRVLFAGGGTGDGTIMLAQQLADAGLAAEVTYLDLSDASRAIAERRAEARGLTNIRFLGGSLLDLTGLGSFDYIDCCGVLHHLEDPAAGLRSLLAALEPGGGIGIMVYGTLGRTGVYPLQDALRTLADGLPDGERVDIAKRLLKTLPATNWLKRNPFIDDHQQSDAGLFDLLLHSRDRAYTVPELAELVSGCGLAITTFIEPARYDPARLIADPRVLRRLEGLDPIARAALAEQLSGSMAKHVAYLVRPEDAATAVARPDDLEMAPVLRDFDGAAIARGLKPGAGLRADLGGVPINLALPRLAGPMLARIDGRITVGRLFEELAQVDRGLTHAAFMAQFQDMYAALNGMNKLLLRRQQGDLSKR
ncbi:methyltransferase [Skermanella stibiiresistens SB22]|uniref:Methyltransferase n=1 Tax=Skermanella stibiiresistens SB22 TaxID=1385369 RepID=W9H366_9PROT|nr:class I SAM-dependent methyltransferase [Skermanella stibiiresistens]EWY39152.1 methyltransferase [Skermanella stibiiresistens SB22]